MWKGEITMVYLDINDLIDSIIPAICYGAGLAMIFGLCEWVVCFFVRAVTDRFGTRRL